MVDGHPIDVAELGRITVLRATPCHDQRPDAVRIANLWDDARTALMATEISTRDNLAPRRMIRFVRDLDPNSLDVRTEMLYGFTGPAGGRLGFTSPSGDSLSTIGYWRRINKSSFRFYGPDANALLSQAFVEDHCFSIASGHQRTGQIGLAFEPVEQRKGKSAPAEITGTVWIDSASSELRSLEFNWLSFPVRGPTEHLGGEVRFTRMPSGSWFVHRWRLRMPTEVMAVEGKGSQVTRARRFGIVEEGGVVETGIRDARGTATIAGSVRDGDGNALAGARVTVVGMGRQTTTDEHGQYQLDSLPAGLHSIVVGHPRYDVFGMRAGDSQVLLDDGAARELSFRGPGAQEVSDLLCEGTAQKGRGTLHLTIIDSATSKPMRGLRVSLTDNEGYDRGREFTAEDETDASGVVVFCNTPPSKSLTLSARVGKSAARVELTMPKPGLTTQVVRWPGAVSVKM
jgi:hypothetical protein